MNTDFTSYWQRKTARHPELADPDVLLIMPVEAIRMLMREAFANGIDHHAAVTKFLRGEAAREASDQLVGPVSLKPEFEEIFGSGRRAI